MADATEVKLHFLDYWRVIRVRAGLIILTFLLVVLSAGVATYFAPKKFTSTVAMELKGASQAVPVFNPMMGRASTDPRFGPTQFEIIQRTEILYPVVDRLDLTSKWSTTGTPLPREYAFRMLRQMLSVKQVRNTEILELTVTSTNPQEAADLANAIAEIYQDKMREIEQSRTNLGLTELGSSIIQQEKRADELFAEVRRLGDELRKFNIVDLNISQPGELQDPSREVLLAKEQEVNMARTQLAALQSNLQQVERLSSQELLNALSLIEIPDPTVQRVLPLLQEAVAMEARLLNSGLGRKHPEVLSLQAQIKVYQEQLSAADTAIRNALDTRIRVSQTQLTALEEQLDDARNRQQTARVASSEYIAAKDRYLQANAQLATIRASLQAQRTEQTIPRIPAIIWQKAEPATAPSSPRVALNMILAVIVGLVAGVGLAFFIEYLDTSVKTLDEVENYLGVPVLAVVPSGIALISEVGPDAPDAEAYRILRTNIEFNRKSPSANVITVVSGGAGEGKSTTFHNLGHIFAQGGYSTILVDADLRRPAQHRMFEQKNELGLSTYLMTQVPIDDIIQETGQDNLSLIPSGAFSSQAIGYLNSQRMTDLISNLKSRYDIVLIDSPPILGVSDASVIVSEADATVLVVQHRRFPRSMLLRVKQAVLNVGGNIVGVVLNNVDVKHDPAYGYYTSYYDYYTTDTSKKARKYSRKRSAKNTEEPDKKTASTGRRTGGADEY